MSKPTLYDLLAGHTSSQLAERNETIREVAGVVATMAHVARKTTEIIARPDGADLRLLATGLSTLATLGLEAARLQRACEILTRQEDLTTKLSEARTAMALTDEQRDRVQGFLTYYHDDEMSPGECTALANILRPLFTLLGEIKEGGS